MKTAFKQTVVFVSFASLLWLLNPGSQAWAGTTNVLQWSFTNTAGSVAAPIFDTSGAGNDGVDILYTNNGFPEYSSDIPTNTQFCRGTGSVDFTGTSAAISTANSVGVGSGQAIVSAAQIYAAGGLTMEVWIKNPSVGAGSAGNDGIALGMGAMYVLGVDETTGQVGFFLGDIGSDLSWTIPPPASGEWIHLAVVLSQPNPTAFTYSNISAYVNGNLIYSAGHTFPWYLTRATSAGNHQYNNWDPYQGLIYEPRITLGALSPANFTIPAPAISVAITQSPTNVLVKAGATATFSVSATINGAPPSKLTYQWLENGASIADATNSSYTTPAAALSDNESTFNCDVSAIGDSYTNYSQTATLYVYGQQGRLLDYPFAFTNGSVADIGATVTNIVSPGTYDGLVLTGDGGDYTNDLPSASLLQNVTGIGSLLLANGALSTDPSGPTSGAGILDFSDIAGNGGLTMETWVKGGAGSGVILGVADTYAISATASGVAFAVDANSLSVSADMTKWHHVAGVISGATVSGTTLRGNVSLYLDGVLQGTITNGTTSNDRQRATTVGNHSLANSLNINVPFSGEVFEPRITLGALSPSQFTTKLLPAGINITLQPQSAYTVSNGLLNFTVAATVTGDTLNDLRYQWLSNGVAIAGATNSAYSPGLLPGGTENNYSCELTLASFPSVSAVSAQVTGGVASQVGTIIQYGFAFTTNSVADNGGMVTNNANPGVYDGFVLTADGGMYTNDVPDASLLQRTTGIGSLSLADGGSITSDPTGATSGEGVLDYLDILGNGGLTLEVWVKGPPGPGPVPTITTVAGAYALEATTNGEVGFYNGFAGGTDFVAAPVDLSRWHHIAGVLSNPSESGGNLVGDINLYVDGVLKGTFTNSQWLGDLQRGYSVGNHPLVNSLGINTPFAGSVFEPRVTLGALTPAQFTINPPPVLSISRISSNVVISWKYGGALYSADELTGPWTSVTNAATPYTNAISGSQRQYFRVQR